jgi:PadR family transcriptional regulator, regulatory protein PadR
MPRTPNTSPQTLTVLAALLDGAADWHYGYPLSKQTGLAPGTLYPILARLVDSGLLETRWEENETPGRPARHLYRLTTDGREFATTRAAAAARPAAAKPAARSVPVARPRTAS